MSETKHPLKVFLCHASLDKAAVRELYFALKTEVWIDPWLDKAKILPGQNWRTVIERAVEESDVVLVCLSTQSVSKEGFVQRELKYAYDIALEKPEETIFLIPLRLDECVVPRGLRSFHWVDYFGVEKIDGYSNLLASLKLRYEQKLILAEQARARQEKERLEREAAENTAREKVERERTERAAQEYLEREAYEGARREKTEREAAEKVALEKAKREAAKKNKYEQAQHRAAQIALLKATFSNSFISFRSVLPSAKPFFTIGGILGVIFVLFWIDSWATPKFFSSRPTSKASSTSYFVAPPTASLETRSPRATPTQSTTSTPTVKLPSETTDIKGVPMVLVPAGEFTMGAKIGPNDTKPAHQVYLDNYYIDKFEVTNIYYKACVDAEVCLSPQDLSSLTRSSYYGNSKFDNFPVIHVNWEMARTYCEWRNSALPTEAQWEKAARANTDHRYPWGNVLDRSYANYDSAASTFGQRPSVDTTQVGSYSKGNSPYGLSDLIGNVSEWVADWYLDTYYQNFVGPNPLGPASGISRVLRGGSYRSAYNTAYTAYRSNASPEYESHDLGFRCARTVHP